MKKDIRILILEDDPAFRELLKSVCSEVGKATVTQDLSSALEAIAREPFQLLLIDGHFPGNEAAALSEALEEFQPNTQRLALFTSPNLNSVIKAMKEGAHDILWAAMERPLLKAKVLEALTAQKKTATPLSLTQLAESLTEKAMAQKTTLFSARKEFSRIFLKQILWQQKLRRTQLADLMQVSPRTLHRHLST